MVVQAAREPSAGSVGRRTRVPPGSLLRATLVEDDAVRLDRTDAPRPMTDVVVTGLSVVHQGQHVLTDIDLQALPGRLIAATGPSGAGKTTLLWALAGLVRPSAGQVEIDGAVLAERAANRVRVVALLRAEADRAAAVVLATHDTPRPPRPATPSWRSTRATGPGYDAWPERCPFVRACGGYCGRPRS